MKITVSIEDPTPDFADKLLALLREHGDRVTTEPPTPVWTVDRAALLLSMLPPRAARIIRLAAADPDGRVATNTLREPGKNLRGHTAPIRHALDRGARLGHWPEGMPKPVRSVYTHGTAQATSYRITDGLLPVFHAALTRLDRAKESS